MDGGREGGPEGAGPPPRGRHVGPSALVAVLTVVTICLVAMLVGLVLVVNSAKPLADLFEQRTGPSPATSSHLQALQADPLAALHPPGATLVSGRADQAGLGEPIEPGATYDARVTRTFRLDGEPAAVLAAYRTEGESTGWTVSGQCASPTDPARSALVLSRPQPGWRAEAAVETSFNENARERRLVLTLRSFPGATGPGSAPAAPTC